MGTSAPVLKGLFDSPSSITPLALQPNLLGDPFDCPPGEFFGYGQCYDPLQGTPPESSNSYSGDIVVNNAINITDTGIQQISDQIAKGIADTSQQTQNIIDQINKSIINNIQEESDSIQSSITNASTNLGDEVKITSTAIAASTAATQAVVAKGITDEISEVKGAITPILTSITGFIDKINAEVQSINDTFISPLLTLYNSTIGTVATLTAAIEQDLKDGLSGLLKIPGQLADQLGSLDATLDRTVQQLGSQNLETVKSGIDYQSAQLPKPFSQAFASSFSGATDKSTYQTTFSDKINLSSESLGQISQEGIAGIGTLITELLHTVTGMVKPTIDQTHKDWALVDSVFVGLLDGLLGLLTTVTAIGSLASPLISAAEQEANKLIPTRKLDASTVIEAMKRGFIDAKAGLSEIAASGLDATRQQVLVDLGVFFADVSSAIDWWYRGVITDADLTANMTGHGITTADQEAIIAGSIRLPSISELIRWMNFGIITQDQFITNCEILRYDSPQIQAVLTTFQDRESPQTLSNMSGLLNNSNAGFINQTLSIPVPDTVALAGQRANYHPDLIRYIWLAHWNIPSIDAFIESYFRGFRTETEVKQRMAIDNIPQELWQELIDIKRPLLPLRTIPSLYSKGLITYEQASQELQQHGHNLYHIQLILSAYAPKASTTNTTASVQVHTLSQSNARTLWSEGALTDEQYSSILVAHGYTAEMAIAQLQADLITEHAKQQKQAIADYTAEVITGAITMDDAISQLQTSGFTNAQIATFQTKVAKQLKQNVKHPTIADMIKFLKAQLITIDDFAQELQLQGWQDPWLSAWVNFAGEPTTNAN